MPATRLLMLNYEFPPVGGGAAMAHLALLGEYAKCPELKVDVLTCGIETGLKTENLADNVTVYRVGIDKEHLHHWRKREVVQFLRRARAPYRRLLADNDYQLVHAFFGFPTGWLCWRTRRRIPYIISLRGSDVPGPNARLQLEYKILSPLFRAIWADAAAVVACSEGLKQRALRLLPDASIDVIPNGVDLQRFHAGELRDEHAGLRLVTVGRLTPTKRIGILIEAVALLREQGRDVSLKVVGAGPLESLLGGLVAQKGLGDVVELSGRLEPERLPDIYRAADIFVSASMQEGMSNAMLEAIATALPIVTTRCEGVDELIADNGVILDDDSAAGLAGAVAELDDDREKILKLSNAAADRSAGFGWSGVAERYRRLYDKIVDDARGRAAQGR